MNLLQADYYHFLVERIGMVTGATGCRNETLQPEVLGLLFAVLL